MKRRELLSIILALILLITGCRNSKMNENYPSNRAPLNTNGFVKLPLGTVMPYGWIKDQMQLQADGLTGHLDEFWPDLINSAWKGGDGESWERTPYYLDGLVPLAFLLEDPVLIEKTEQWVSAILSSARDTGWFGPEKNTDRWPLAVASKVLISFSEATGDTAAIDLLSNYFRYIANSNPDWPDDTWRGVRAMELAVTGYRLYRITGQQHILDAIKSIQENSFDWLTYYQTFPWDSAAVAEKRVPLNWKADGLTAHVVNNAMGIKYPGLWYQQSGDEQYKEAVYKGISDYDHHHGQAGGRFSGDEHLNGKDPVQGTELCSVVEYMFSLETLTEIMGDPALAERFEMLAYNALPATLSADFWSHQYDQQANQVLVSDAARNWSTNRNQSNIYGLMPNYPCCLANMHQGWPRFVENMWMATNDNGLAAVALGPSVVKAKTGKGQEVTITETTDYPFNGIFRFEFSMEKSSRFPFMLRIPSWAKGADIKVNGRSEGAVPGTFHRINRKWADGDIVEMTIPMGIRFEKRYQNSLSLLRGPLYYSLRIAKEYKEVKLNYDNFGYMGSTDWEISPLADWNYALVIDPTDMERGMEIITKKPGTHPFGDRDDMVYSKETMDYAALGDDPPVIIKARGMRIPSWQITDNSAGPLPASPVRRDGAVQIIELVPYGSTRLRITEFPWVDSRGLTETIGPSK